MTPAPHLRFDPPQDDDAFHRWLAAELHDPASAGLDAAEYARRWRERAAPILPTPAPGPRSRSRLLRAARRTVLPALLVAVACLVCGGVGKFRVPEVQPFVPVEGDGKTSDDSTGTGGGQSADPIVGRLLPGPALQMSPQSDVHDRQTFGYSLAVPRSALRAYAVILRLDATVPTVLETVELERRPRAPDGGVVIDRAPDPSRAFGTAAGWEFLVVILTDDPTGLDLLGSLTHPAALMEIQDAAPAAARSALIRRHLAEVLARAVPTWTGGPGDIHVLATARHGESD